MNQNHRLHPAVLPLLTQQFAMEPTAQARLAQRLTGIPADQPYPTAEAIAQAVQAREERFAARFRWELAPDEEEGDDQPCYAVQKVAEKPYQIASGTAIIPLIGVIQKREDIFSWWFCDDFTATETFIQMLKAAEADEDVTSILIYGDSPGGYTDGVAEAADAVYTVRQRGKKPLVGYASDCCCSAALWIMAQCPELYCNKTAQIGSIGTRMTLMDLTEFYAQMGVTIIPVTSGTYKAAGLEGTPITSDVKAYYQELIDRSQVEFTSAVSRGRKLPIDDVRKLAGEARIYIGSDAQGVGLVDGIRSAPEIIKQLQKSGGSATGASSALGRERKPNAMSNRVESFLAWLKGDGTEAGGNPPGTQANDQGAAAGNGAASADSGAQAQPLLAGTVMTHPLVVACQAAGINTPEMVQAAAAALTERDSLKSKLVGQLKATAKAAAIRATGREMASTVDAMTDIAQLEAFITDMTGQADAKFGTSATAGAQRQSQAQNPQGGAEPQQAAAPTIDYQRIYGDRQAATNGRGK